MSLWRHLTHGVRVLTRRSRADRALGDEVDHYLQEATAAYMDQGLSPEDAGRAARMEVGNALRVREEVRDAGWERIFETLIADLRYAVRGLVARPGFAIVSVLTLALGIGASTAIFSAVNPILFETLPYPRADRVAMIWDRASDRETPIAVTFGTYRELLERTRSFESLAVMRLWQPTMTGASQPERLDGQRISARYFHALGVLPLFGRSFEAADDVANGPRVVVLSDRLWQRRFAADPAIIGRAITLDDNSYTVIGIMPRAFENVLSPTAAVWTPLQYDVSLPINGREWGHHLQLVARLADGASVDTAARELDEIARSPVKEFARPAWASLAAGLLVSPLQTDLTRAVRPALLAVVGAVLVLLAIACVNVTNLMLARTAQRRGEVAMRVALGAPRRRLVQQFLTESLVLAAIGGAIGLLLANAGVRALRGVSPADLPRLDAIDLDVSVFLFAAALTSVVGVLVGVVPAIVATSRSGLHAGMQQSSRRASGSHQTTRRALVILEVALSLVLLIGAGLLMRSVQGLFAIPPGFDSNNVVTMQVQVSGRRFRDPETMHRFFGRALEEVRNVPGVMSAALTSQLPLSGDFSMYGAEFEEDGPARPDEDRAIYRYAVSPDYFETLAIPLRRGRLLESRDIASAPGAAVISESLAQRKFGDRDPIGHRVRIGASDGPWATVVGVVGDVKQGSLADSAPAAAYTTTTQWRFADNPLWLVIRGQGDVLQLVPSIRNAIWSVDKDQPIVRVATLASLVKASEAQRGFALVLFQLFGAVSLVLAAIGIYGVLAGGVTERTREIGIRAALGASRSEILGLIVRQGLILTAIGVGLGVIGAVTASGSLSTMLYGVSQVDPITYGGVVVLLAAVSAAACALPAYRAARVDPALTLRAE